MSDAVAVEHDAGVPGAGAGRRVLFLALTALMYALVAAGFWPYWRTAGVASPPRPWVVHLHAAVFTGWMALLLAQVLLVRSRQVKLHRRLGTIGISYGCVVFIMGCVAATVAPVVHVQRGEWSLDEAAAFLIYPAGDMLLFGALFGAAVLYRRRTEIHKRCILMATVALMFAPVARMVGSLGTVPLLALWLTPVLIAMMVDLRVRKRIHPAYLIGTAWLLLGFGRLAFAHSPAWLRAGRAYITAATPAVERIL